MAKYLIWDPILAHFGPNLFPKIFLWVLPLLHVRNCCKLSLYVISRKTNEPNLKKWKKKKFWAWFWPAFAQIWSPKIFLWVLPLLDVIHCYKLSLYAISRKTNEPHLRKWHKTYFWTQFWPVLTQIWLPKILLVDFTSTTY